MIPIFYCVDDQYAPVLAASLQSLQVHATDERGIVTSNHFHPLENLAVRKALGIHRLFIVSQLTNFAMTGSLGWLMRNADTVPIANDRAYAGRVFPELMANRLNQGPVLIYPEQELWYNYRKPRPGQRGAYYYAARFNVPIISLFVEIPDDGPYVVHILETLYPDPQLPCREASRALQAADDAQRRAAYEAIYHRPYTDTFDARDIANRD